MSATETCSSRSTPRRCFSPAAGAGVAVAVQAAVPVVRAVLVARAVLAAPAAEGLLGVAGGLALMDPQPAAPRAAVRVTARPKGGWRTDGPRPCWLRSSKSV